MKSQETKPTRNRDTKPTHDARTSRDTKSMRDVKSTHGARTTRGAKPTHDATPALGAPIYGIHPVEELMATRKGDIEHIYFDKDKKSQPLFNILRVARRDRMSYNLVPEAKLNHLAQTTRHQGIVAFCSARPYNSTDDLEKIIAQKPNALLVVAASIEDSGNLGAIIRSCVCLGVDALLLERKNTAPLSAVVAKTSAGMLEHLCVVKPRNLEGIIGDLVNEKNFTVYGADAKGDVSPDKCDLTKPTILIIGGEHKAIPPYLKKLCSQTLSIPMTCAVENPSLNASASAAILLYECGRQRRG